MKKILCIIDELGSGGAERQLVGLACLLKNKGYTVEVFCYHPIYFYAPVLAENNVKLIEVDHSPRNCYDKLMSSYRVMKSGNYDFIISFSPGSSFAVLLSSPFLRSTKILVSDRNMTPEFSFKQKVKFNLYRFADYIVPNSYTQTDILRRAFPFMRHKLHTITNFVDTSLFRPKSTYEKKDDSLRLIVVARHAEDKNIPAFIHAVNKLKNDGIALVVQWYGSYENEYGKRNCELVKHLHLEDTIHFLPPNPEINISYLSADALCLPSVREGFSNVIAEAMSCGLPVLCGNISDNPRMIEDGVNGFLFNPYSVGDMASIITKFSFTTAEDRAKIGKANILKAEAMLSIEAFVNKYIDLIEGK